MVYSLITRKISLGNWDWGGRYTGFLVFRDFFAGIRGYCPSKTARLVFFMKARLESIIPSSIL